MSKTNAKKTPATAPAKTAENKAKNTAEDKAESKKARLELCDWKDGIPVSMLQTKSGYSMKVRPKGIKTEDDLALENNLEPSDFLDWLEAIQDALRNGYDVNILGAVHAFVWVKPDGEPTVCLKTIGNYRKSLANKAVRPFVRGHETTIETAREMRRSRKAELDKAQHEHVTPSSMVECPRCGYEFRVGKQLV